MGRIKGKVEQLYCRPFGCWLTAGACQKRHELACRLDTGLRRNGEQEIIAPQCVGCRVGESGGKARKWEDGQAVERRSKLVDCGFVADDGWRKPLTPLRPSSKKRWRTYSLDGEAKTPIAWSRDLRISKLGIGNHRLKRLLKKHTTMAGLVGEVEGERERSGPSKTERRRANRMYMLGGKVRSLSSWARTMECARLGVTYGIIQQRIFDGWDPVEAATTPPTRESVLVHK